MSPLQDQLPTPASASKNMVSWDRPNQIWCVYLLCKTPTGEASGLKFGETPKLCTTQPFTQGQGDPNHK